jgi:predicted dehydrogenase
VGADVAASPDSCVVAVGSRDGARAQALADTLGAARAYPSYEELVADADVDVVYVATTHAQHHRAALAALDAGKPVLVEKPIALNARQGRQIAATAADRGLLCLEGMWTRLNPTVKRIEDVIASGEIGDVRAVRIDLSHRFEYDPRHRLFDPEVGGGALLDLGVYPAALAWLLLGRPDGIQASATLAPTGVDASDSMLWTYSDGRFAQLTCSAVGESGSTATILGTRGWIEAAGMIFRTEEMSVCTAAGGRTERHPLPPGNGYGLEVLEVEKCLAAHRTDSADLPLAASLGVLEVLDEARRQIGVRYPGEEE